jgi:hypothetical protein
MPLNECDFQMGALVASCQLYMTLAHSCWQVTFSGLLFKKTPMRTLSYHCQFARLGAPRPNDVAKQEAESPVQANSVSFRRFCNFNMR